MSYIDEKVHAELLAISDKSKESPLDGIYNEVAKELYRDQVKRVASVFVTTGFSVLSLAAARRFEVVAVRTEAGAAVALATASMFTDSAEVTTLLRSMALGTGIGTGAGAIWNNASGVNPWFPWSGPKS